MKLPEAFVARIERDMGAEGRELLAALDTPPSLSVRFNPYKISEKPEGEQVPWCRYGFMLDQRPVFTLDPLFHGGAYYVQDASSMFIEHLARSFFGDCEGLRVLDLCAAPGGKTTLLSSLVGLEGLVVANEVVRQRANILADNVRKWGLGNVVVTNNDPSHFAPLEGFFDCVVVDAPCSGEGMFRKDPAARGEWSEDNVALCAARQKRILADVWPLLREGGCLIYSTCTFNRTENEDNVAWLTREFDCEGIDVTVDGSWGIVTGETEGISTFRFYPGRVRGEGFFAAALRKTERTKFRAPKPRRQVYAPLAKDVVRAAAEWTAQPEYNTFAGIGDNVYLYYTAQDQSIRTVAETMTAIYSGVSLGQFFGRKLRPDHPLALFHDLNREIVPTAELDIDTALDYLRLGNVDPSLFEEGINLVACNGFPLGWAKRIGLRVNNMYPKELRIRDL